MSGPECWACGHGPLRPEGHADWCWIGDPTQPSLWDEEPCGTTAAYHRHLDRGEPVDAACRQARRDYDRALRARKR